MTKHVPVKSSVIKSLGYNEKTKTLIVRFSNGSLSNYVDVPKDIYNDFMKADSKGKFLSQKVKGTYDHRKRYSPKKGKK